jgi:ribose transport system permease protein
MDNFSLLILWAGLIVLFGILEPDTFLTTDTFKSILSAQAITAIMALSLLLPIASNQFDLSIAGAMGIAIVLVAVLLSETGLGIVPAIAVTLVGGVVIGCVNAFLIVKCRIGSFITTLATGSILYALINWLSNGEAITEGIPESFTDLGRTEVFGLPIFFFYMLAIAFVLWFVLEHRQTGRYLYAIGSNADAARLAGLKVGRLTAIALITSAVIATIAGIIFVTNIGAASTEAGPPYLLPAFAAAFLGATQFKAGNVNVLGTLVAVYALATGVKGVQLLGAPFWVEELFNGVALLVAVGLAVRSGRQRTL